MRNVKTSIGVTALLFQGLFAVSAVAQQAPPTNAQLHASSGGGAGWSQGSARRLYESGSACGPDRPEPVWEEGNKLLGYECKNPSANGS